jgi:hypothetical protein
VVGDGDRFGGGDNDGTSSDKRLPALKVGS